MFFPYLYAVKDMTIAAAVAVMVAVAVAAAMTTKTMAVVMSVEDAAMLTAEARVRAWQ